MFEPVSLTRVTPNLPPEAFKTYEISAPISTHTRPGTCEEAFCVNYRQGFKVMVDPATELGAKQAWYLRQDKTRDGREVREPGGLVSFVYPPGTKCFAEHRIPLEREPMFRVRGGDYRGNPRRTPLLTHSGPDSWVDDFATHQENLANAYNGKE